MQGGGDSRDFGSAPAFYNFSKVVVHPGEASAIKFDVKNRYNSTVTFGRLALAFHVGGDWLNATSIVNVPHAPAFAPYTHIPLEMDPGEIFQVDRGFTTSPDTPPGTYLVSLELEFTYRNETNIVTPALVKSFGSLSPIERNRVDLHDPNATLATLGVDAIAPDTSITVDDGQAGTLFAYAVGFGVAVVVIGSAAGYGLSRRSKAKRRKKS